MAAKRILIVSDGSNFSRSALHFAFRLFPEVPRPRLVGMFIQDLSYLSMLSVMGTDELSRQLNFTFVEEGLKAGERQIGEFIQSFESECRHEGFPYEVHFEQGSEIVRESRFSDLIIIGYQTFFANVGGGPGDHLLKDVLKDACCPILVVPENTNPVSDVILAYDGSPSSAHAFKQFSYLMPEDMLSKPLHVLHVGKKQGDTLPAEEEKSIQVLAASHFPKTNVTYRFGDVSGEIQSYASGLEHSLIVIGAYGRSLFSMLFHPSASESILQSGQLPVFITHT